MTKEEKDTLVELKLKGSTCNNCEFSSKNDNLKFLSSTEILPGCFVKFRIDMKHIDFNPYVHRLILYTDGQVNTLKKIKDYEYNTKSFQYLNIIIESKKDIIRGVYYVIINKCKPVSDTNVCKYWRLKKENINGN